MSIRLPKNLMIAMAAISFDATLYLPGQQAVANEILDLPPQAKSLLLRDMQDHIYNLDDIMAALSEGNFNEAAKIATIRMTKGHKSWEKMASKGKTIEEIMAKQKSIMGLTQAEIRKKLHGQKGQISVSQFAPEEFIEMGNGFHDAAKKFATDAFKAHIPPKVEDYQKAFENIQQMTSMCRACHDTWDLK